MTTTAYLGFLLLGNVLFSFRIRVVNFELSLAFFVGGNVTGVAEQVLDLLRALLLLPTGSAVEEKRV